MGRYSASGRCVDPTGLHQELSKFYRRYKLPIMITENGLADSSDVLRPAYILEHMVAIGRAIEDGIPISGYIHWTLTDNFEWTDGYCPKFGLVSIDRNTFERTRRDSFYLYLGKRGDQDPTAATAFRKVQRQRALRRPHRLAPGAQQV